MAEVPDAPSPADGPPLARAVRLPTAALAGGPGFGSASLARADLAIAAGVLGAFTLLSLFSGAALLMRDLLPRGGQFLWVLANGLLSLATVGALLRRRGQPVSSIGLNRPRPARVLAGAAAAVPLCYLAGAMSNVLVTLLSGGDFLSFARDRTEFLGEIADIPLGWVFPISLFVGFYEEILFRGFLISRLRALCRGPVVPAVASSVVFGLMHFSQGGVGMCQTAVVGLVLAAVVLRSGSLWPAIVAHAAIDSLSLAVTVLLGDDLRKMVETLATQPAP
jgi:membrane protease YdiL (CAAX protease family)